MAISEKQTSYPVEINMMTETIGFLDGLLSSGNINDDQLKEYIQHPMSFNKQIRSICKKMYNLNGIYGRTVDKMVAAPTLDYIVIPNGKRKKDLKRAKTVDYFLNKMNHKLSIRDMLFVAFTEGMYVAILRNTKHINKELDLSGVFIDDLGSIEGLALSVNAMIQPLDRNYVKFIGYMNGDYVCAFDMMYFDQFKKGGLIAEIKNYPPDFIKAYNDYRRDSSKRWYVLDQKTTLAFKYRSKLDEPYGRPLGLSALNDIFFAEDYTDGQRSNLRENASTIRWMAQPEGEKKGQCSLNKEAQTNQFENFKKAVSSSTSKASNKIAQTTSLVIAPGTTLGTLDANKTLIKDTLTKENISAISTDLGLASAALNGEGEGASYSSLAVNIDLLLAEVFQMLEQIEWQFTKLLNNFLEIEDDKWVDIHYLRTSNLNRKESFEIAKDLYTNAGGSRLYLYAVGTGNSNTYLKLMDYEREMGFEELYPPHVTSFTTTKDDGDVGGRPPKDDPDLKDGGLDKTYGGNKQKRVSKK